MPPEIDDPKQLSTDVKYLYKIANAVSQGFCSPDLENIKPGPISHARWITKASRILRLYMTTNNPPENLKILSIYIIKIYVPMYFNIKYYQSVIYGSVLLGKFIKWSSLYLSEPLRNIVEKVVLNNSYYAHSENVLLSMLFDDRKEMRELSIQKILFIRDNLYTTDKLRKYEKPKNINFNCSNYIDMIDLNNTSILHEPPFTKNISYEELKEYLNDSDHDPPYQDPKIPCHIQNTERHVQLCTAVSNRVTHSHREGVMEVTLESRFIMPNIESKQDLKRIRQK